MTSATERHTTPPPRVPVKRRVRNFLLDPIQLKYTAMMVVICAGLVAGLGYFIYAGAREASRVVNLRAMDPTDTLAQDLVKQFAGNDRLLLVELSVFGILIIIFMTGYGIIITHKVAGPIYKLSRYCEKVRDGNLGPIYPLRQGDQLQDFYHVFEQMHDQLRKRSEEEIRLLVQVTDALSRGATSDAVAQLEGLREKHEVMLAGGGGGGGK